MNQKTIWVFAEERSGSTWLTDTLCINLHRTHDYVELDREHIEDSCWRAIVASAPTHYSNTQLIFQTHRFSILESLNALINPVVVLRTTRKNVIPQLLSYLFMQATRDQFPKFWRLPMLSIYDDKLGFEYMVKQLGTLTAKEDDVEHYFYKRQKRDSLWRQHSHKYENQTIYYEDLYDSVSIPALNTSVSFNSSGRYIKLPYDTQKIFSNYPEIIEWVKKYE